MPSWWNFALTKCQVDKIVDEMVNWGSAVFTECQINKMTSWWNVKFTKCQFKKWQANEMSN
jgi:hypothetical protein